MGFMGIGISSRTDTELIGAILQIISHGFIGAGTSYKRICPVYLDEMHGIAIPMPKRFTLFSSFSPASLALPGMSGFIAELIVFCGIIASQKYLLLPKIIRCYPYNVDHIPSMRLKPLIITMPIHLTLTAFKLDIVMSSPQLSIDSMNIYCRPSSVII
ncbi:hypothetical protein Cgig2_003172 [Carnegiea gigantea]|uniref:NADH:quinone oxidoreductase/Mrp antiporter transmembrane domain-containing protein n=1 Tax=Carnegiea gigantea TaxID=171969 RepID=A0A9Q1QCF8_9CARY|nr:hypothetical protein Cgig2_003172 [Carnegiea gigantea]